MNVITTTIRALENFQRRHTVPGFLYAVIKKYGSDNGGYQAAIITYYGLLSLFPLLIVFTSLSQLLLKGNPSLRNRVATSATHYFPVIGNQLQQSIHSPKETGIALVLSLLITLYGARGGAGAIQYAVNSLWHTSRLTQPSFFKKLFRNFGMIAVAGIGLVGASILSSYSTILGRGLPIKVFVTMLSAFILWCTFISLFKLAIAGHKVVSDVIFGALTAAIGLQVLQTVGNAILTHELKSLHTIYGTFALVIGLLFWLYLQAEVILYAIEVDVVRKYHLFPRSLQGELTAADKVAYQKYSESTRQHKDEKVRVRFHETKQGQGRADS